MSSCLCTCTERRGLIFVGLYMWVNALFNIIIVEWDREKTILFLQGELDAESAQHMQAGVLNLLLVGINLACGLQVFSVTFAFLHGVFFNKKCLIVAWLWLHSFQLAFYIVYLFAGVLIYSIVGDSSKIILLLYGFTNILIGFCAWKMAFNYVRHEEPRHEQREVYGDPRLPVV